MRRSLLGLGLALAAGLVWYFWPPSAASRAASASEQFAALLRDNGAAALLGAPTMGIGCGYTGGGVVLELPHTGLTVRAPDCIRYRRDGSNEADGVLPDIPVSWEKGDDGRARAAKVLAALPRP